MKGLGPCLKPIFKNSLTILCKEKLLENIRVISIEVLQIDYLSDYCSEEKYLKTYQSIIHPVPVKSNG